VIDEQNFRSSLKTARSVVAENPAGRPPRTGGAGADITEGGDECYQPVEIKNCHLEGCALWPFRMGRDPAPHPGSVRGVASRAMILDGTGRPAPLERFGFKKD